MSETSMEPAPLTPKEQLDQLILQAQQGFEAVRLQAASQEGFLVGLRKVQEIWNTAIIKQDSE